jgi:hypothetical protein
MQLGLLFPLLLNTIKLQLLEVLWSLYSQFHVHTWPVTSLLSMQMYSFFTFNSLIYIHIQMYLFIFCKIKTKNDNIFISCLWSISLWYILIIDQYNWFLHSYGSPCQYLWKMIEMYTNQWLSPFKENNSCDGWYYNIVLCCYLIC